jgi:RHH-type transcriptional regulator, rel operon repressor / antitoxin RelB
MSSEVLSLRVDSKIKSKILKLGKAIERPTSYIAEKALEEYLERNAWQINELKAAKKEIKENKFISDKEVNEYLDSWSDK